MPSHNDTSHSRAHAIELLCAKLGTSRRILTGPLTINREGPLSNILDPNGADRTVTLPPLSSIDANIYFVANIGTANSLVVETSNALAVATIGPDESAFIIGSGAEWISHQVGSSIIGVFGPSGPGHSIGLVPDPGAVAGSTRYLREDGSWSIPAGGGGSLDAFAHITDGTNTADGTGLDTFKLRSSGGTLSIVVTDNDGTHGDNANFDVIPGAIDHNALLNYSANRHIDHTAVSITTAANSGLAGGGTIAATRSLSFDAFNLAVDTPVLADGVVFGDISSGDTNIATFSTLNGILDHNALLNYSANRHIDHTAVSIQAGVGLTGGGDISATRTLNLAINGLAADTIAVADSIPFYDVSGSDHNSITFGNLQLAFSAFTSGVQGVVPASGGGTTNFLRADATWAVPTATQYAYIFLDDPTYGAVGNGTTDDRAALLAAYAACAAGGTILLGAKTYALGGTGSEQILIDKSINIRGVGSASKFRLLSTVPTTTDLFHIQPTRATLLRDLHFVDFEVDIQGSSAVGRHIFHFDTVGQASVTVNTNATTAIGNNILHFASVPATVVVGMSIYNTSVPADIPALTTVTAVSSTTVTMSANVVTTQVGNGNAIKFIDNASSIAEAIIERVTKSTLANAGVNCLYINNGNGNNNGAGGSGTGTGNLTGGTYNFTASMCYFGGPMTITYGGDTLRFRDMLWSCPGAIQITQVSGAGQLLMSGGNYSVAGGLTFNQSIKPVLQEIQFEQQTTNTQYSVSVNTSASSAAGSTTLTFSAVPSTVDIGQFVFNATVPASLSAGTRITAKTATTVTITPAVVVGQTVGNGNQINFGGAMVDFAGTISAIDSPVVANCQFQSNGSIGNTVLMRVGICNDLHFHSSRFGVPTTYTAIIVNSNAARTKIGNGNTWPGLASVTNYLLDGSQTTVYPYKQVIMGSTGATTVLGTSGAPIYLSPGLNSTTESSVYLPWPINGIIRNLAFYSQGSPGAGATYVGTLRNALADTTVTATIPNGSNSASDTTHKASVAQFDRWSFKFYGTGAAPATTVAYSFEVHMFEQ